MLRDRLRVICTHGRAKVDGIIDRGEAAEIKKAVGALVAELAGALGGKGRRASL